MPRIRLTLEAALKRADMSGRELERRTGVHRDTIGKYRHNAVRMINLDILERFCAALGCRLADLLTDAPPATVEEWNALDEDTIEVWCDWLYTLPEHETQALPAYLSTLWQEMHADDGC